MRRIVLIPTHVLVCGLLPTYFSKKEENEEEFNNYKLLRGFHIEDPWERVKTIFKRDPNGSLHPEMLNAISMFQYGFAGGAVFGGMIEYRKEVDKFKRTNDSSVFLNQKEAYRQLSKEALPIIYTGAIKWGVIFSVFIGGFSLVSSCCEQYRNRPSIVDNTIGGCIIGGLLRFPYGIKGMISGGLVGGALGTLYGTVLWSFQKLFKTDVVELKYAQYAMAKYAQERKQKAKSVGDPSVEALKESGLFPQHTENVIDNLDKEKKDTKK